MNIEKRIQGKRIKYYLAHSFREGSKVKKARRYLGVNLTREQINKLRPKAELLLKEQIKEKKSIFDPLKHELSEEELNILKNIEIKGKIEIEHLSEKDWENFTEIFAYNTNAIEGSEVKQKEVKDILKENKWAHDINKRDISETYGVANAVKYIRETKEHISINLIKKLHEIVFVNSKDFAGNFRKKDQEVVIKDSLGNVVHVGAKQNKIYSLLKELVEWYDKNKKKYPPILLASVVHNQFENIHPFADGNGRVGRLLLNNILLKHNMPPVNISLRNRREYYLSLREYQNNGNIRPTLNLILKEYKLLKKELKR